MYRIEVYRKKGSQEGDENYKIMILRYRNSICLDSPEKVEEIALNDWQYFHSRSSAWREKMRQRKQKAIFDKEFFGPNKKPTNQEMPADTLEIIKGLEGEAPIAEGTVEPKKTREKVDKELMKTLSDELQTSGLTIKEFLRNKDGEKPENKDAFDNVKMYSNLSAYLKNQGLLDSIPKGKKGKAAKVFNQEEIALGEKAVASGLSFSEFIKQNNLDSEKSKLYIWFDKMGVLDKMPKGERGKGLAAWREAKKFDKL